jgi:hypothetical protein
VKRCVSDLAPPWRARGHCAGIASAVVDGLIAAVRKLATALRKSLTWDRGAELASQSAFTVATDVQVISAIHQTHGDVDAMKYQWTTAAILSKKKGQIFLGSRKPITMLWQESLIPALGKH